MVFYVPCLHCPAAVTCSAERCRKLQHCFSFLHHSMSEQCQNTQKTPTAGGIWWTVRSVQCGGEGGNYKNPSPCVVQQWYASFSSPPSSSLQLLHGEPYREISSCNCPLPIISITLNCPLHFPCCPGPPPCVLPCPPPPSSLWFPPLPPAAERMCSWWRAGKEPVNM